MKYEVLCKNCGLDHIQNTPELAEKESRRHKFNTGHDVEIVPRF